MTSVARLWIAMMFDILISGGRIVDGAGLPWFHGDIGIRGDRIAAIGKLSHAETRIRIDAAGKVVAPGFIDAHVHGDLMLLIDPAHEPAIRQGVTTYILGQDGVAMAPASPATLDHMRRYTAGFSGGSLPEVINLLPKDRFLSVAEYLALFDRRTAVNVATLIPNGNVRMEVVGLSTQAASAVETEAMARLVREGMEQGAVGLSSGLDYIPSRYSSMEELTRLCQELASFGGVYVTHMRGYAPDTVLAAMDEVFHSGREAGIGVHISHFNSQAGLVLPRIDAARAEGVDVTYDLYCYLAGSSILGMVALPLQVQEGGVETTLERLRQSATRERLREILTGPRGPLEQVRLSWVAAEQYRHLEGMTLAEAATETGVHLSDLICEVLLASDWAACCVAPHRQRTEEDVRGLMRHPAMMAGSDGIFTGSRPHPRGWGCFARYLGHYVRDARVWTLEQAVQHLSAHAARRFGLKDRGLLREGMAADVGVFDPAAIADRATFTDGRQLAAGMEHVLVNGELVLHKSQRTSARPGRALKRQ
jgi:N-acyl-D-amino-acid deacylase